MLQFLPFLIYCLVKSVNFLLLELAFQFLFLVLGVDLGGSHLEMIDETPHQCYKRKRLYENSKRRKERRQTLAGKLARGKARGIQCQQIQRHQAILEQRGPGPEPLERLLLLPLDGAP
jgi:hypothetical protein